MDESWYVKSTDRPDRAATAIGVQPGYRGQPGQPMMGPSRDRFGIGGVALINEHAMNESSKGYVPPPWAMPGMP